MSKYKVTRVSYVQADSPQEAIDETSDSAPTNIYAESQTSDNVVQTPQSGNYL